MLCIDYGSGYNPKPGYKTCDITESPMLDYVVRDYHIFSREGELESETVDAFHCRNVLHHIKDLKMALEQIARYLKKGGTLEIIEPTEEAFGVNWFLDCFWYRWFDNGKRNVWFSDRWRDYVAVAKECGFEVTSHEVKEEKDIWVLTRTNFTGTEK